MIYLLLNICSAILYFFPNRLLYFFSDLLYLLIYYILRYRRKVVRENLKSVFPQWSTKTLKHYEKKTFLNISDIILETIKSKYVSKRWFIKKLTIKNVDSLKATLENKNNLLLFSHLGNWELIGISLSLTFTKNDFQAVYKQQSNKQFERYINSIRTKFGSKARYLKEAFLMLVRRKTNNHCFIMVMDQIPLQKEPHCILNFFNRPTVFYNIADKIQTRIPVNAFQVMVKKIKRGQYEIELVAVNKNNKHPYPLTQQYSQNLEKNILQDPSLWLWTHKRWKRSIAEYSNNVGK